MAEKYNGLLKEMLVDKQENASYRFLRDLQSYSNMLLSERWNIFSQRNATGLDIILELESSIEYFYDNIYSKLILEVGDKAEWETETFKRIKKYIEIFLNKGVRKLLIEFNPTFGQRPIIKKYKKYRYKTEAERSGRYSALKIKKDRTASEQQEYDQIIKHYTTPRFLEEDTFQSKGRIVRGLDIPKPRGNHSSVPLGARGSFYTVYDGFDGREYRFDNPTDARFYKKTIEDLNALRENQPDKVEGGLGYYGINYRYGSAHLFNTLNLALDYTRRSSNEREAVPEKVKIDDPIAEINQVADKEEFYSSWWTQASSFKLSGDVPSTTSPEPSKGLWSQMSEQDPINIKEDAIKQREFYREKLEGQLKKYLEMKSARVNPEEISKTK